jgi:seryl-tRNA synthetase
MTLLNDNTRLRAENARLRQTALQMRKQIDALSAQIAEFDGLSVREVIQEISNVITHRDESIIKELQRIGRASETKRDGFYTRAERLTVDIAEISAELKRAAKKIINASLSVASQRSADVGIVAEALAMRLVAELPPPKERL